MEGNRKMVEKRFSQIGEVRFTVGIRVVSRASLEVHFLNSSLYIAV